MKLSEFNEVYDTYYLMVMKVAFNILHDYHYSQDVCQEVFLLLYSKRDVIETDFVKPWLIVTAQRKAIDFQRKKYVKREICEDTAISGERIGNDVAETCIRNMLGEEIFEKLKDKDRHWYEIIQRVLVEGESQQSVANDLGISLSNLRIKLHRAKAWLRKNFPFDDYF